HRRHRLAARSPRRSEWRAAAQLDQAAAELEDVADAQRHGAVWREHPIAHPHAVGAAQVLERKHRRDLEPGVLARHPGVVDADRVALGAADRQLPGFGERIGDERAVNPDQQTELVRNEGVHARNGAVVQHTRHALYTYPTGQSDLMPPRTT